MVSLQLTCLGDAAVTLANEPLTGFQTDKMRALLIYLALEGQSHQRAALAHLLWPGYSDESARHSLRQYLHRLRVLLRDDEPTTTGRPPWLLVTRQTVQFNPAAPLRLDVARFRTLLAETAAHPHAKLYTCPPCLARLRQAAELYQGDFLAGFTIADSDPFEEWRRITQEQLHLQALSALSALADAAEAAGDEEQTLQDAQRLLTLEPWLEAAHRRIMRILGQRGQRAAALAQYNRCRQVLTAELGATPEAETLALYEQIQRGDLDKERRRQEDKVTSDKVTIPPSPPLAPAPQRDVGPPGPPHNLPLALPTLVGRGQVIDTIKAALRQARLVTLTGMGGVGKTTLAVQVAHALLHVYRDGVWWLELAALTDGALMTDTLAGAFGLSASAPAHRLESLVSYLQPKTSLLLLDNCEHLLPATRQLCTTLLTNCPHLRILATSRAPLHLQGEQLQPVTPLATPAALPPFAELLTYGAIQLFVERARASTPTFALTPQNAAPVLEICRRLDGLPLALELAAARLRLLSPQELAAQLDQRFRLLRAAPSRHSAQEERRHQTLQATIDWGYELLRPAEQALFRRLAVFAGGYDRTAAASTAVDIYDGTSWRSMGPAFEKS